LKATIRFRCKSNARIRKHQQRSVFTRRRLALRFTLTDLSIFMKSRSRITLLTSCNVHLFYCRLDGSCSQIGLGWLPIPSQEFSSGVFLGERPVNLQIIMEHNNVTCRNQACEYESKLQRTLTIRLSRDRLRYARLWTEVELPKLLNDLEKLQDV
jgi:hypothetical protein